MKVRLTLMSAAAAMLMSGAAQAGFYFEGLTPYAESYCNGADAKDRAWVSPPPEAWDKTSPDESTLAGRPAWDADCSKQQGKGSKAQVKPAGQSPKASPVPQK